MILTVCYSLRIISNKILYFPEKIDYTYLLPQTVLRNLGWWKSHAKIHMIGPKPQP
jgi:hypothetical protein